MSNPFTFEEDDDDDEGSSNIPAVPDSSSEDSESSSSSSKSGCGGSDEYDFDTEATSSGKRLKKRKFKFKGLKRKCMKKIDLEDNPVSKKTLANDEEYEFEEDTEFENPFLNHTRPVFCLPNMSQDKMKPSQSYITPELLRVNKFEPVDMEDEKNEALEHTDESLRRKREELNKQLQATPLNIELWLKFLKFQDVLCAHEKLQNSASSSSSRNLDRVYAEKKLSILDKALKMNPNSEPLCNQRYESMKQFQPIDKVLQDLKLFLGKQRSNLFLHREYLRCLQHNMNRGNVDQLLEEYHHAIQMTDKKQALSTLLEFGCFLKQAGLWEILLCVVQQYLEENLNNAKGFDMGQVFTIQDLSEQEEQKFLADELAWISQLDTTELSSWLRAERDRSAVHFLPVTTISTCIDDTERYCLPDDVIKFVRPLPSFEFLLSISLTLLKVPPLPLSHSAWVLCLLGSTDNGSDDVELLQTGHFSLLSHLDHHKCTCPVSEPSTISSLSSPPSYMFPSPHSAHDKYRDTVLSWWQSAIGLMEDYQQIPMYVWLFRFSRFLSLSASTETARQSLYERMKPLLKDVLKQDKFRSAVPLYVEFAYFERDFGKEDEGIKVLSKLLDSLITDDATMSPSASILNATRALALLLTQNNQQTEALTKYKQHLSRLFHTNLTFSSLLSTIKSYIDTQRKSFDPREELFLRSLYESHMTTELILAVAWLLYLSTRTSSADVPNSSDDDNVYSYLAKHIESFDVSGSLDASFYVKETLAEQLCLFLVDEIRTNAELITEADTAGSVLLKLKHNLSKFTELFPNNATLIHLCTIYCPKVLVRTPHVLPNVSYAIALRDASRLQSPRVEHSELIAKVSLLVHRKYHAKNSNGEYECDCNILALLDRMPSSKALVMSTIEYFCAEDNKKQGMDLHSVLIEKHLRVHIPYDMVKVLGSNPASEKGETEVS